MSARHGLIAAGLLTAVFMFGARADAQQIYVASTQADTATNVLTVRGAPLNAGARVFLGLVELTVNSATGTELRATLPTNTTAGTYTLVIVQPSTGQFGLGSVTVNTPSSGAAPRIVDATGRLIGTTFDGVSALMGAGADAFRAPLTPQGFGFVSQGSISRYFLDASCSGTSYIPNAIGTPESLLAYAAFSTAAGLPLQPGQVAALAWISDRAAPTVTINECTTWYYQNTFPGTPFGVCTPQSACGSYVLTPLKSIDLTSFVPPFRLVQ